MSDNSHTTGDLPTQPINMVTLAASLLGMPPAQPHTPGPWFVQGSVQDVGGDDAEKHALYCGSICSSVGDKFRGDIAHIQSCDHIRGISREEAAANARLIAAAPDLLAALKVIADVLFHDAVNGHALNAQIVTRADLNQIYELARVAIASAEGRANG